MRAILRRAQGERSDHRLLTFDPLEKDLTRRLVRLIRRIVHLTPTEYASLEAMATNAGKLLTHEWLLRKSGDVDTRRRATTFMSTSGSSG